MKAKENEISCQNLKAVLKKDGYITANYDRQLCTKAPIVGAIHIIISDCYKRRKLSHGHCLTLAGHPGT